MKAALVKGAKRIVVEEVPDPVPADDEVIVKVQYCGICGSDLHIYEPGAEIGAGHEYSGDIVALGSKVEGWKVGDRVAVEPRIACGKCNWCQAGKIELCDEYYSALLQYEGAFATYTRTTLTQLHKLPDNISYEQAALIEPVTCALHAVNMSKMRKGDVVAVLGLGPIGQLVARMAKILGAKAVYATEVSESRIDLAKDEVDEVINVRKENPIERILQLTNREGVDIVIECAGSVSTSGQSIEVVRKGGTIIVVGICYDWIEIPFSKIVLKELTIKGSICFSIGEYASGLDLVKTNKIDVKPLITNIMPLDNIDEAFEIAARGDGCKILIKP